MSLKDTLKATGGIIVALLYLTAVLASLALPVVAVWYLLTH